MKIKELSRDNKIKIVIALIGVSIGVVISEMFWSEILRLLGQSFFLR